MGSAVSVLSTKDRDDEVFVDTKDISTLSNARDRVLSTESNVSNVSYNSDFKASPTLKPLELDRESAEVLLMGTEIKLLHADDCSVTRRMVEFLITKLQDKYGCTIDFTQVTGGDDIVSLTKITDYDVIISDNDMGSAMDGTTALDTICKRDSKWIKRAALLSANRTAVASTESSYIKVPKPVTQKKIVHIISTVLRDKPKI